MKKEIGIQCAEASAKAFFRTVSFSDVFHDMLSKNKRRPQDEFTDKIVLIGSTAPSLFDVKPTPMSRLHPGVEILATAIDNLKHGDYLRYPEGRILIPQALRQRASITREVVILGVMDQIEIWDKARWEAKVMSAPSREELSVKLGELGV